MNILYGIQGTGNGHLAKSKEVVKRLAPLAKVDVLISGGQHEIAPGFDVAYQCAGIGFVFGKTGGIDYWKTFTHFHLARSIRDVLTLPRRYDVVVSDFEPITAYFARLRGLPSVAVSHQAAVLQPGVPRPSKRNRGAEWVMKRYAPCRHAVGLHFRAYTPDIVEPIIRQDVRDAHERYAGRHGVHYVLYLPSFDHRFLVPLLAKIPAEWVVFSKHLKGEPVVSGNVRVYPTGHPAFEEQFATARGVVTNAGFETIAEALYMGKKIFAVPMKGQYEQYCNAAAAETMGVKIGISSLQALAADLPGWVADHVPPPRVVYGDPIPEIIRRIQRAAGGMS